MKCRFQNKKPLDSQVKNQGALLTINDLKRKTVYKFVIVLEISPEIRLILLALLSLYSRSCKKSPSVMQTRFPDFRLKLYRCFPKPSPLQIKSE